jgi:hypothetical protein
MRRKVFEKHCYRRLPIITFLSLINLHTSFEVEFEEFIMGAKEYVKQILLEFYT